MGRHTLEITADPDSQTNISIEDVFVIEVEQFSMGSGKDGADGEDGKSAYESYLDTTSDDPVLSEEEWAATFNVFVDGITITGAGTELDPFVATGGESGDSIYALLNKRTTGDGFFSGSVHSMNMMDGEVSGVYLDTRHSHHIIDLTSSSNASGSVQFISISLEPDGVMRSYDVIVTILNNSSYQHSIHLDAIQFWKEEPLDLVSLFIDNFGYSGDMIIAPAINPTTPSLSIFRLSGYGDLWRTVERIEPTTWVVSPNIV